MPRLLALVATFALTLPAALAQELPATNGPIDRTDFHAELQAELHRAKVAPPPARTSARPLRYAAALATPPALEVFDATCSPGNCPANLVNTEGQNGQYKIYDVDTAAAASRFFQEHPDTAHDGWDEVVIWTTFLTTSAGGAYYMPISNDVQGISKVSMENEAGIGSELFNLNGPEGTGSKGFLKGTVLMSDWHSCRSARLVGLTNCQTQPPYDASQQSQLGILGQEVGHRWGAFLHFDDAGTISEDLLGRDVSHWSYYVGTGGSPMEGNDWQPTGAGNWQAEPVTAVRYSPLDEYAMGLLPDTDVPPTLLIEQPMPAPCTTDKTHPNVYMQCGTDASTPPGTGLKQMRGTERDVGIDEIEAVEGPRQPAFPDSPRIVHLAFVLFDLPSEPADQVQLTELENLRRAFTRAFYDGTDRRMRAITTLSRRDDLGLFDFTLDAEGWTLDSSIHTGNGQLVFPLSGVSTASHTNLELDASREQVLHLKLSAPKGSGALVRLGWANDDDGVPAGQTLDVPVPSTGQTSMLEVPMTGRPGWSGSIHRLEVTVVPAKGHAGGELDLDSVETEPTALLPDQDGDFVPDSLDDCPKLANTDQADQDGNGSGDVCDAAPDDRTPGCGCSGLGTFGLVALAGLFARRRRVA